MSVTITDVHHYFETYGWKYDFEEDTTSWHTGFRGETANFNITVHLTEDWLYFFICPFVNAPLNTDCEKNLYYYLLRLNHAINMAKFSLDTDGDVVLTVELPVESLDYSEFADGLNAVSFYADAHYLEILNLAQDPDYAPSFPQTTVVESTDEDDDEPGPPPDWNPN